MSTHIESSTSGGQTLSIFLDPDDKVTSAEFTNDTYVNLYKTEEVTIE